MQHCRNKLYTILFYLIMMDLFQVHVMEDLQTYSILLGESVKKNKC